MTSTHAFVRIARLLLVVACTLATSGCFAWAAPPLHVSEAVTERAVRGRRGPSVDPRVDVRVAAYPLEAFWTPERRPIDVGIGYQLQPAQGSSNHEAVFLEVVPPPLVLSATTSEDEHGRGTYWWALSAAFRGSREYEWGESGWGGAVQILTEGRSYVRGRNGCGKWSGDFGVGLFAEGGYASIEGTRLWSATFGFVLHAPAALYAAMQSTRC